MTKRVDYRKVDTLIVEKILKAVLRLTPERGQLSKYVIEGSDRFHIYKMPEFSRRGARFKKVIGAYGSIQEDFELTVKRTKLETKSIINLGDKSYEYTHHKTFTAICACLLLSLGVKSDQFEEEVVK